MFSLLLAAAVSFLTTAMSVPIVRAFARRTGWLLARATGDRWHRRPAFKAGGVAMCVALVPLFWIASGDQTGVRVLLVAAAMCVVGLVDDVHPLRPATKFCAQLAVAATFLLAGPVPHLSGIGWLDAGLSMFWILLLTNAFNLLDNIDGLSAGIAAIASVFVILGIAPFVGLASLAGATLAFLLYNRHPASVFMGDSGSHLLGSFIACSTLSIVSPAALNPIALVPVLALIFVVPIADTSLVIVTRRLAGVSPFVGGRDHLSHRLVALGWTDRTAVFTLYGVGILGGLAAAALRFLPPAIAWPCGGGVVCVVLAGTLYAGRVTRAQLGIGAVPQIPGTSARGRSGETIAASNRGRATRTNPAL